MIVVEAGTLEECVAKANVFLEGDEYDLVGDVYDHKGEFFSSFKLMLMRKDKIAESKPQHKKHGFKPKTLKIP